MISPKRLQAELELIEAMLDDKHPTARFSRVDMVLLVGAAHALRWAMGGKGKPITRMVVPRRRRIRKETH